MVSHCTNIGVPSIYLLATKSLSVPSSLLGRPGSVILEHLWRGMKGVDMNKVKCIMSILVMDDQDLETGATGHGQTQANQG